MKKCTVLVLVFLLLSGCSGIPDEMKTGMELRSQLLQAAGCSFTAKITADYGDKIHTFTMNCQADSKGETTFSVVEPDSISGITGKLSGTGGKLTFDNTALCFELISDKQLSPVSAPWILINTLRSGCMMSACKEEDSLRLSIDDSYEEDPLRLDIWLNSENLPETADILYDGRRILSVSVMNFELL